jgi:hypothetical protein
MQKISDIQSSSKIQGQPRFNTYQKTHAIAFEDVVSQIASTQGMPLDNSCTDRGIGADTFL